MTDTIVMLILVGVLIVLSSVVSGLSLWIAYKTHRCLLHMHVQGNAVVQVEIQKKTLDVRGKQADAEIERAKVDRAKVEQANRGPMVRRGSSGAMPNVLTEPAPMG